MEIRRARGKDTDKVIYLLQQVLELHAAIRPDIYISGTTKYTAPELAEIFADDMRPVYVATDEEDAVLGYVFCMIKEPVPSNNIVPYKSVYIDDLCVDDTARGKGIGKALFLHAVEEARRLGCRDITLNVWEGNDSAKAFYEQMGMKLQRSTMEYRL